jgi:hypothetical protein
MKLDSLQFGKAMSAALFVLLLSVVGMKNAFAQNQVATLQHNDTITAAFYGENAFREAYTAAVDGDIITLSSGSFAGFGIYKSITIHGAGCVYDSLTRLLPTNITGNVKPGTNNICFEGIRFTGAIFFQESCNNNSFIKCCIEKITTNNSGGFNYCNNWQFVNCIIKSFKHGRENYLFHGMSLINSVVRFENYYHNSEFSPTNIYNSVVLFDSNVNIKNIVAYNSIIATVSNHVVSNSTFFNCIGIETGETLLFEGQIAQNVMEVDSYEDVFETFEGEVTYDNIYQLQQDIATTFLGHDGTEVGIYGGITPYKTRPSYMILKNCNVAGQSDENKKLNVEMELIGPEDY